MTKHKLNHYFDVHPITVVSKYPHGVVIQNPEAEGMIAKWVLELMGQNISYAPCSVVKYQVLADFIAEWTEIQTPRHQSSTRHGLSTLTARSWSEQV
jgi:hypothetical protein